MAKLYSVAGSKIYIGPRVAGKLAVEEADFTGLTWTQIEGWTNAGAVGDSQNFGSQTLIAEGREIPFKTTVSSGTVENQFIPNLNDAGQIKMATAASDDSAYAFKIEWSAKAGLVTTATISVANPGVVTVADGHGLEAGAPVSFSTTGALPTGLTAATTYYVVASGLTATEFSVSATSGGAAIETTGAGSGVHTLTALPQGETDYFHGLVGDGQKSGGDATASRLKTWMIARYSNLISV